MQTLYIITGIVSVIAIIIAIVVHIKLGGILKLNEGLLTILTLAIVAPLFVGMYDLNRTINWGLSYNEEVVSQVCQMVKPEVLKDEYKDTCKALTE